MSHPRLTNAPLFVAALLIASVLSMRTILPSQKEFGDGREYILQTQAIALDRSLAVDPAIRGDYWNRTNPFAITLPVAPAQVSSDDEASQALTQCAPGFGSLYRARDGSYRFAHTWIYSLVAAPLYALMHTVTPGPGEYLSFRYLNLLLLFTPLLLLLRLHPTWATLGFLTLVLISPLTPHLQWAHSEIFCFSAVLTAFVSLRYPRLRRWGPIVLGLGAAQNIPIVLFFPLHFWLRLREERPLEPARVARVAVPYVIGSILPAVVMAHYYYYFGTFNLIAAIGGADMSQITANRMLSVLFSPLIGVFWYFPAAWLAVVVSWKRPDRVNVALACASVAAVAMLCSATTNINSAQLSAPRYALWFLAPLYYLPFAGCDSKSCFVLSRRFAIALIVMIAVVVWLQSYQLIQGKWEPFYSLNRANSRVAKLYRATRFDDDIEPLVENIQGRELVVPLSFSGVYIWDLGGEQSVWIVSKRAWLQLWSLAIAGDIPTLESSASLTNVFNLQREENGSLRASPKRDVTFRSHPYWGSYLVLWVDGDIASVGVSPSLPITLKRAAIRGAK